MPIAHAHAYAHAHAHANSSRQQSKEDWMLHLSPGLRFCCHVIRCHVIRGTQRYIQWIELVVDHQKAIMKEISPVFVLFGSALFSLCVCLRIGHWQMTKKNCVVLATTLHHAIDKQSCAHVAWCLLYTAGSAPRR